jgi:hypothetical protein
MLRGMRITVELSDDIVTEARSIAARTGRGLSDVVEEAVRESFARRRQRGPDLGPALPQPFGEGGLLPGVDLDCYGALLDTMDVTVR